MIPLLTFNENTINSTWPEEDSRKFVRELCAPTFLNDTDIPVYMCDDGWLELGLFNEADGRERLSDFFKYGYCDSDAALAKYLKKYIDAPDRYFVHVHLLDMDYEKPYKFGSYIDANGVDTEEDYWLWADQHPDEAGKQEYENAWLAFSIVKIKDKQ